MTYKRNKQKDGKGEKTMNLYKFRSALTVLVLSTCLLALVCIAALPTTVAAKDEPWQTSIQIPVVVNIYNNAGVTTDQINESIKEANKLLKQADMKLVVVETNPPGPVKGDNGNGEFTRAERDAMRTFGGKELKKTNNEQGIKLSFGKAPNESDPLILGVAIKPEEDGKPTDPTIILKYTGDADTGKTITHELGHVMGITGDYEPSEPPKWIMNMHGSGNKFKKDEIKQMKKYKIKYKFGKCYSQWQTAFAATKDKKEFGATTDDAGDQGNPVSAMYDLHQVYLTSVEEFTDINAEIDVAGLLPTAEEIDATYSLGFDIDDNTGTGVTYAGYDGIDRIVYVNATGNIGLGTFTVSGEAKNTITGTTDTLPEAPEAVTMNEICDFEALSKPIATSFFFKIPKTLLSLSAAEALVVVTAGENNMIYDITDFIYDSERWLKDPTFTTFGTGVPNPGGSYPFEISGLEPNDPFDLYLDDTLILSDTLDGSGDFSGNFVFPSDLSNSEMHFLTAQDSTGEFAYSFTCPKAIDLTNLGPEYQEVLPGETATYTIRVTNLGSETDTILLEHENVFESGSCSWTVGLSKDSVTLDPDAHEDVILSVTADSNCDISSRIKVKVTGTSQNGLDVGETITDLVIKETHVVPEFATIAIPVVAILGLLFLFARRRRKE